MAWQDVRSHYTERDDPDPPHVGSVQGALHLLEALAGRIRRYQDKLPDELCDIDFDVAEVVRELEATFPPEPEPTEEEQAAIDAERAAALAAHDAEFDRWERLTDRQREDAIRRAMG